MEIVAALQSVASPTVDAIALAFTNLGHEFVYVGLLVIAYLSLDPERGRSLGILFLVSMFLNGVLKGTFVTDRPYLIDPEVLRPGAEATVSGAGFPSGHTQGAVTFWGIAALHVRRRSFTVLALFLMAMIAISRVYLGVHLPLDIVGGLVLGLIFIAVARWLDTVAVPSPSALLVAAGILVPGALHVLLPSEHSGLLMGGLAAFITAPSLFRYRLPDSVGNRVTAGAIGLVLVFAGMFGSSAILPDVVKDHLLGSFFRYMFIAYLGLLLAPWLVSNLNRDRSRTAARG